MAQCFDVVLGDAAEFEPVGDIVHMAPIPRKAVVKRAVEIEDNEGIGHRGADRREFGENGVSKCSLDERSDLRGAQHDSSGHTAPASLLRCNPAYR
jgi:hypothetical protein